MSILRAPKAPDMNCDIGKHTFRYALYPHLGNFEQSNVVQAALCCVTEVCRHLFIWFGICLLFAHFVWHPRIAVTCIQRDDVGEWAWHVAPSIFILGHKLLFDSHHGWSPLIWCPQDFAWDGHVLPSVVFLTREHGHSCRQRFEQSMGTEMKQWSSTLC